MPQEITIIHSFCGHTSIQDLAVKTSPQKLCKSCDKAATSKRIQEEVDRLEVLIASNTQASERLYEDFEKELAVVEDEPAIKKMSGVFAQWLKLETRVAKDRMMVQLVATKEQIAWELRWRDSW